MGRSFDVDDQYVAGDHWLIDDRTGERIRKSEAVQEWTGAIVRREDAEPRHPQEYVRGRADRQAVRPSRPDPPDTFVGPPVAVVATSAIAGATTLEVDTSAEFLSADRVSIFLANGDTFYAVLSGIPDATHIAFAGYPLPWAVDADSMVSNLTQTPVPGEDL